MFVFNLSGAAYIITCSSGIEEYFTSSFISKKVMKCVKTPMYDDTFSQHCVHVKMIIQYKKLKFTFVSGEIRKFHKKLIYWYILASCYPSCGGFS